MKPIHMLLPLAALVTVSACDSVGEGYVDTQPPYTNERTASHSAAPVVPPAPEPEPTPAPVMSPEPMIQRQVSK